MALSSASETASSCTSISPIAISFATKDRSRNLSRSTLRAAIASSLYLCPAGSMSFDELITAWMLRAYSIAPVTSMSRAARA